MKTHEHTEHDWTPLASEKVKGIEKTYYLDLLENQRGLCVRITERCNDRRNRIIIAVEDFDAFCQAAQTIETELRRKI